MAEATREEILERMKDILVQASGLQRDEIVEDAFFNKDRLNSDPGTPNLELDSLDLVEMVMELEDQFGMKIPDDEAKTLTTVGRAIDYVYERRDQVVLRQEDETPAA